MVPLPVEALGVANRGHPTRFAPSRITAPPHGFRTLCLLAHRAAPRWKVITLKLSGISWDPPSSIRGGLVGIDPGERG